MLKHNQDDLDKAVEEYKEKTEQLLKRRQKAEEILNKIQEKLDDLLFRQSYIVDKIREKDKKEQKGLEEWEKLTQEETKFKKNTRR